MGTLTAAARVAGTVSGGGIPRRGLSLATKRPVRSGWTFPVLVGSVSYASSAALETAFPAAANSGKYGWVGTVLYGSNGSAWSIATLTAPYVLLTADNAAPSIASYQYWSADSVVSVYDGNGILLKPNTVVGVMPAGRTSFTLTTMGTPFKYGEKAFTPSVYPSINEGVASEPLSTIGFQHYGLSVEPKIRGLSYANCLIRITDSAGEDEYLSLTALALVGDTSFRGLKIVFDTAEMRQVEIIGPGITIAGIAVGPTDFIGPARPAVDTWYELGDSYWDGALSVSGVNTISQKALRYLGVKSIIHDALGGTGVLKTNGANTDYLSRLTANLARCPRQMTGFLVCASINDGNVVSNFSQAQITAAATSAISMMRAHSPLARIDVVCFASVQPTPAGEQKVLAAWQAAVANLSNVRLYSIQTLLTGTGTSAAPAGSGTSDVVRGSDSVHYTQAGADISAMQLASLMAAAS